MTPVWRRGGKTASPRKRDVNHDVTMVTMPVSAVMSPQRGGDENTRSLQGEEV